MKIGTICFMTSDVRRLAAFYKKLFNIDNGSDDPYHQVLIPGEPCLAICHDDTPATAPNRSLTLAFTVEDIHAAWQKVLDLGAEVVAPPTKRPWGAINMSFYDPDRNTIYLRSFPNND